MDMILGILPGESYSGIHALADLSMCINKYQQRVDEQEGRRNEGKVGFE